MIPAHIASWALRRSKPDVVAHVGDVVGGKRKKTVKKQERVLQSKGAKAAPAPDPQKEAEARNWEAQQNEERARIQREAEAARKAVEDAQKLTRWQGSVANAEQGVQNYGRQKLAGYGLDTADPYGIWETFTNTLGQNKNQLQDNQDYSTLIGNSVFDNVLADTRSATRNKLERDLTQSLGATYIDDTFANTIDDPILDAILGDQYTAAQTSLKNAMDRGQMGQSAYDRALSGLGTKKTAARGELENTGRTAIGSLRNEVQSLFDSTKNRVNNFDFGDIFDVSTEANKIRDKSTDALGRLDSTVRQTVGDKQFFDPNSIIQSAIAAGGASNYTQPQTGTGIGTDNGKTALNALFTDQARNKSTEGMF